MERITDADLDQDVALLVLAACEGLLDQAFEDDYEPPEVGEVAEIEPPGVYLGDLTVEGFRGIGEPRTLPLQPGPG